MARTIILGRSGQGKSWFGGKVLEDTLTNDGKGRVTGCGCGDEECDHDPGDDEFVPMVATGDGAPDFDADHDFERAIHVDIEDEERGFSNTTDPILLTYTATKENIRKAVKFNGDPPDYIPERALESGDPIPLPAWVFYKNRYIRVVPEGLTKEELVVLVEILADAAMKSGDTHFSLDEAHLVAKKHNIGDKLMRLATGGRKRGVEWMFASQRPQKLHEDLLSQSDYTVYFALNDRDRDKAAEKSEAVPNAEDQIEALQKREAIIEDFDRGEYHQFSTESLDRSIPHVAGDDGKANPTYEALFDAEGSERVESEFEEEDDG